MAFLIGTWTLLDNNGSFDEFLQYYGYTWLSRKAASVANADVTFSSNTDHSLTRKIESTFLNGQETYYLDGKAHKTPDGLMKTHTVLDNDTLQSVVSMGMVEWTEDLQVVGDILFQSRYWYASGEKLSCISRFKRNINADLS